MSGVHNILFPPFKSEPSSNLFKEARFLDSINPRVFSPSLKYLSLGGEDFEPEITDEQKKSKQKNLYENFVKERDREERGLAEEKGGKLRQG